MPTLAIITEDNEVTYSNYTGSGPLAFTFPYAQKEDLNVDIDGVTISRTLWDDTPNAVDGGNDGGSILLTNAVAGKDVRIWRDMVRLRASQFSTGGATPRQIDAELNRLVLMAQDRARNEADAGYTQGEVNALLAEKASLTDLAGKQDVRADTILLSEYGTTPAQFESALVAARAAGKWLDCENQTVTLTALKTTSLTSADRLKNLKISMPAKVASVEERIWTIDGPDYLNVTALSANAAVGASSVTVSSATNIVAGGLYLLISNAAYNPDPAAYGNPVGRKSEWVRVAPTYSGGTAVPLSTPLQSSYLTADSARLYRVSEAAEIWWDNVSVIGGGSSEGQGGIQFNRCVIKMFNPTAGYALLTDWFGFSFNQCHFDDAVYIRAFGVRRSGLGYGAEFVGCNAPKVARATGLYTRHLVTLGGSYTTTLPFSGGDRIILGRNAVIGPCHDPCAYGSVFDVHTAHVGYQVGAVTGALIAGNSQEAVTLESHGGAIESIRVTGADLPVSILYYGHPSDEPSPVIKIGSVDTGYGGSASNHVLLVMNRDASTRNTLHVHADTVEGSYPGGIRAEAEQGSVHLTVNKAVVSARTTHTVHAVSSANGYAEITIDDPFLGNTANNASIYTAFAEGSAYEAAFPQRRGALIRLNGGAAATQQTAFRATGANSAVQTDPNMRISAGTISFDAASTQATRRERLSANRTYYVRSDGSDVNTGLANTASGAFQTIARALAVAEGLDLNGFTVTIQLANGTYTTPIVAAGFAGAGTIAILGDETTPANVTISTTSAVGFMARNIHGRYWLRGLRLQTTTSGECIEARGPRVRIEFQNCAFHTCASHHITIIDGAVIEASGNYSITGNAITHVNLVAGAVCFIQSRTVTLTGTPAFSTAFAQVQRAAVLNINGNTFSGSATGTRHSCTLNGVIFTGGAGGSYLPGNAAGSEATGGQFA